jgi:UDP-galactopyranose mutase
MSRKLTIVNLSHLAWERKLFQRPQQLATRFAERGHEVSYFSLISFKRYMTSKMEDRIIQPRENLLAQHLPFIPLSRYFKPLGEATLQLLYAKARAPLSKAAPGTRVLWLQNPSYIKAIDRVPHDVLVYDAMDPFRAFAKSGEHTGDVEDRVLRRANVVFTGGRSLHSLIEGTAPGAHCFPSGIDFPHFAKGAAPGPIPADLAKLPKPVLGYFGAVDERIDWKLISVLCQARRHWSIVFLGPLVLMDKIPIDEPNFHWLGPKPYDRLPDYLRGFDVCLIPWLVNDLTRYMSPTKTPEYLAAGRPVVSTPIPDVERDYAVEALIARTPEEYISACTTALMRGVGPAVKPPQSRTWDEIADEMLSLMTAALPR